MCRNIHGYLVAKVHIYKLIIINLNFTAMKTLLKTVTVISIIAAIFLLISSATPSIYYSIEYKLRPLLFLGMITSIIIAVITHLQASIKKA